MKLYHVSNGRAYSAPQDMSEEQYTNYLRSAYGSLRGVTIVHAASLDDAVSTALNLPGHKGSIVKAKRKKRNK